MSKSSCLSLIIKPIIPHFPAVLSQLFVAGLLLSSIPNALASFDQGDYYSEFVPALEIKNDTRNNLIMLLSPNPVLVKDQISLSFDETAVGCNLLQANILADVWGAKNPRWCNNWEDSYSKTNFYNTLFVTGKNTAPHNGIDIPNDLPFGMLPATDQALLTDFLIPLFTTPKGEYSSYDKYGRPLGYYDYAKDSSVSNNLDSVIKFIEVVNAEKSLSEEEKITLKKARLNIYAQFKEKDVSPFNIDPVFQALPQTGQINEFKQYLIAAQSFYQQKFSNADALFTELTQAENSWIAETAQYMLIRTALNQVGNYQDRWEFKPNSVNPEFVNKTFDAINAYQMHYPEGQYRDSAPALARRIYWFREQYNELENTYESKLQKYLAEQSGLNNHPSTSTPTSESASAGSKPADQIARNLEIVQLVDEIAAKLLEEYSAINQQKPILAFIEYLKDLRQEKPARFEGKDNKAIEAEVETIAEGLTKAGLPDAALYFRLLTDWRLYQNAGILMQFPTFDEVSEKLYDPSVFAMQILRSEILRKIGETEALVDVWQTIISSPNITLTQQQYAQLQLAGAYIANHQIEKIFAQDSPILNLYYREAVLSQTSNDAVLRQQAISGKNLRERRSALLALFKNHLYQDNFTNLAKDFGLMAPLMQEDPQKNYPENFPYELRDGSYNVLVPFQNNGWPQNTDGSGRYECPNVQTIFERLAQNGTQDAQAALCFGDFLLENYSYDWQFFEHYDLLNDGVKTSRHFNRGKIYDSVLNNAEASYDEKAYALFRKINCYATSGNNSCGDKDVEQSERKRWFNQLKKTYSKSLWAQNLKYYW